MYLSILLYLQIGLAQSNIPVQKYLPISDSVKLYYEIMGQGDTLVIIHGGPGLDHTYLLPQFGELSDEFTLIFYDQRGTGKSECVIDSNSITLDNFVDDLENLRMELKLKKMNLLGHSWGGFLAMNYAIMYPEKVNKVVLISTIPATSDYLPEFINNREIRRTSEDAARLNEMMSSDSLFMGNKFFMERLTRLFFKSYFYNQQYSDDLTITFSENTTKNFLLIYTFMSKYFSNYDLRDQMNKLLSKFLIIHGKEDVIPIEYIEQLYTALPNSELIFLDNCGHFPFIESREEFISVCNYFLKEP